MEEKIKINGYNIFINTTNFDNTPVSVIEAMSLGLPVVSTNVGGIPFLLENNVNAILVEINDSKSMALAIKQLILYPNFRNEMVITARSKVEKFDWNYVKNEWFQILK